MNILLGKGNDRVTVTRTMVPGIEATSRPRRRQHGGITTIHGGGNLPLAISGAIAIAGNWVTRNDGIASRPTPASPTARR